MGVTDDVIAAWLVGVTRDKLNELGLIESQRSSALIAPWCLSYHPSSPLSPEDVVGLAKREP